VAGRLRDSGVKASTVTVKIRDSSFHTITRQRTLKEPTDLTEPIFRTALELARPEVRGRRSAARVTASGLGRRTAVAVRVDDPRRRRVVEAEDLVRHRYGDRAITRPACRSRLPAPFERDPMTPVDMRTHAQDDAPPSSPTPLEAGEEPDPIVDDDEVPA
jgi:DNA polymerase-4